jgi:hypothetical protein
LQDVDHTTIPNSTPTNRTRAAKVGSGQLAGHVEGSLDIGRRILIKFKRVIGKRMQGMIFSPD